MTDPLAIWRNALDPKPILNDPFVRPGSTLMAVENKLTAVQNFLGTLNDDHPEHGLAVAGMAVDFTFSVLAHLGLEDGGDPTPPITNRDMGRLAVKNLRATVRGHIEAWQRAAENDDDESEAIATTQDEAEAAPATQGEAEEAPQDLIIDHERFTIRYKGRPCELGNTYAFHLFVRLAEDRGVPVSHHTLAEAVWGDDLTLPATIHKQVSLLGQALRDANIDDVVIDSSTRRHYILILG